MNTENQINYVEFPASDFEAVKAFYGALFDWNFEHFGEEYLAFNDGRLDGGFYRSDKRAAAADGAALVIFYTKDLEGLQQRVIDAGGAVCVPTFPFPGGRRFHFHDPHGNELAVWTDQGLS